MMSTALLLVAVVLAVRRAGGASVEQTEALLEWIRDLGGGVDGISLQPIPGMGMGAVATRDLEAEAVISRTPLSALISLEHAVVTELFGALSDELPELSNTNLKAFFLAYERKRGKEGGDGGGGGREGREEGREGMEEGGDGGDGREGREEGREGMEEGGDGGDGREGREEGREGMEEGDRGEERVEERVEEGDEEGEGGKGVEEGCGVEECEGGDGGKEVKEKDREGGVEREGGEEGVHQEEGVEEGEGVKGKDEGEEQEDNTEKQDTGDGVVEESEMGEPLEKVEVENTMREEEEGRRVGEREETGRSFWQPYLDILPNVFHTTLFFTEEELEYLQISMVKEFAVKQQRAARKAFEMVAEVVDTSFPELKNITLEDLKWGVSVWSSRAHSVRVRDSLGEWQIASCLVPVADMFNMAVREEEVNVRCDTNEDSTHFECHTTTTIPTGKQGLVEYASRADKRHNGRLLMHYGFVVPGNPHDSVSIKLPLLSHDVPHFRERQEFAKQLPVLKKPFLQLTHPDAASPTINELLQVIRLTQGSIPELERASHLSPPFSLPLGPSSEQRVLKKTVDYLRNIISSYPTSVEQDVLSLHATELSTNSWLAVVLRSEEKRLLTANMAHLLSLMANSDRRRKTEL